MTPRFILASTSPRRRELLGLLGLPFEVVGSAYDESRLSPAGLSPAEYVTRLAQGKAAEVAGRIGSDALVLGADTTVVLDGEFLNKPADEADARRMLRRLSGRTHEVYTGLCLIHDQTVRTNFAVTEVTFSPLSDAVLDAYVATGEPLDKAGGLRHSRQSPLVHPPNSRRLLQRRRPAPVSAGPNAGAIQYQPLGDQMKLQPNCKLVMIGDSITDGGRARPVGEGLFDALGHGYVAMTDALLGAVYPERGVRVVNMGSSGNTVRDLAERWQTDVLDLKPDWLSVMIGTNDVWRQFDSPRQPEGHVLPDEYAETLDALVAQTLPLVPNIVLMTPFYLEPNPADPMRRRMDEYGAIVRQIAAQRGTLCVDTQAAFAPVLAACYPAAIGWDRVHPNQTGQMVLARAFLDAVDFAW